MASLEDRVKTLEQLLFVLVTSMSDTREAISNGFKKIDENFINIDKKFNKADTQLLNIQSKIDTLSGETDKHLKKVHIKLVSIQEEISKINTVTGYEEAVNNMRAVKGGKA